MAETGGKGGPALGLGCANLANMAAGGGGRRSVRLVEWAIDHGIDFFDTADAYGDGASERVIGKAIRGRRDAVTVATKAGFLFTERGRLEAAARRVLRPVAGLVKSGLSRAAERVHGPAYVEKDFSLGHLRGALDQSLCRLDTDYIDVYQMHEPEGGPTDELLEWAASAVQSGKVRRFGVSVEQPADAAAWLEHDLISSVQTPYGITNLGGARLLPSLRNSERLVIVRGVLGAGVLDDRLTADEVRARTSNWELVEGLRALADEVGVSVVQLAVWFVRRRADIDRYLVGISSIAHAEEIVAAGHNPLPGTDVLGALDRLVSGSG
jgi:aryl-alcohol dehydrogenase-like predicted oxidoreductase